MSNPNPEQSLKCTDRNHSEGYADLCSPDIRELRDHLPCKSALEATQGQMDGFVSQLPYNCHIEEVASVGD